MKTINELKMRRNEISSGISKIRNRQTYGRSDLRIVKKALDEIKLIDCCIMYIERQPSEEIISAQIATVEHQLKTHAQRYSGWYAPSDVKFKTETSRRQFYNKAVGVPKLKKQLKTLKYLQ